MPTQQRGGVAQANGNSKSRVVVRAEHHLVAFGHEVESVFGSPDPDGFKWPVTDHVGRGSYLKVALVGEVDEHSKPGSDLAWQAQRAIELLHGAKEASFLAVFGKEPGVGRETQWSFGPWRSGVSFDELVDLGQIEPRIRIRSEHSDDPGLGTG